MHARRIIISSMPRAGSMWTWNVTRSMIAEAGWDLCPKEIPTDTMPFLQKASCAPLPENGVYCVKTHLALEGVNEKVRILSPIRDIRAVTLSYMRFVGCRFDQMENFLKVCMDIADRYTADDSSYIKVFRYEQIRTDPLGLLGEIDEFLGIGLDPISRERICKEFSRDKVRSMIAAMPSAEQADDATSDQRFSSLKSYRNGVRRVFDHQTGFQSNHVTSQSDDEWRTALAPEIQQYILNVAGDWLDRHGFER